MHHPEIGTNLRSVDSLGLVEALAEPERRQAAASALARQLGGESLHFFAPDPELGVLLPAPGTPQVLRGAEQWRRFLERCVSEGSHADLLPGSDGEPTPARGCALADGTAAVLIGGSGDGYGPAALHPLLSILGALFRREREIAVGKVRARAGQEAVERSQVLTRALQQMRESLEVAVARAEEAREGERERAEQAEALTTELEAQAEELQHQATELEENQAELEMTNDDLQRANTDLEAAETHYRRLVETSPYGVFVLDMEGGYTEMNPAGERLLGRSSEEMLGLSFSEVVAAEDLERARDTFVRLISGQDATLHLDLWVQRSSGERRLVDVAVTVIRDDTDIVGVHGVFRDITEERKTRESIQESEASYRTLFDSLSELVYIQDRQGVLLNVNEAALRRYGYSHDEILGRTADLLVDVARSDMGLVHDRFRRACEGESQRLEIWGRTRAGESFPKEMTLTVGRYFGRDVVIAVARDITERKHAEQKLRRAERLASVGTLIGGVAHELNNPLHAIYNFSQLMLLEERAPDDQESLEIIRRESERMAKIVADLKQIARNTQEEGGDRTAVDLNEIVRHVLRVQEYRLKTSNAEVHEDLAEDVPMVLGERGALEQVVLNLVTNAEQAMASHPGKGRLMLRTRASAKGAALHVVDNGPGIPANQLERIWDPFFTTKSAGEGTGLGLALVHSIIAEHGGEIRVDSQVGRGTAFRIDLPRAASGPNGLARTQAVDSVPSKSLRILVVDDEASVRLVTVRYLKRRGHQVDEAAEGAAALEMLDEASYDVILSDLRMPGLGGEAMMERLREGGLSHKVIFVTGDASGAGAWLEGAGVPVLLKPVRLEEMALAVEAVGRQGG